MRTWPLTLSSVCSTIVLGVGHGCSPNSDNNDGGESNTSGASSSSYATGGTRTIAGVGGTTSGAIGGLGSAVNTGRGGSSVTSLSSVTGGAGTGGKATSATGGTSSSRGGNSTSPGVTSTLGGTRSKGGTGGTVRGSTHASGGESSTTTTRSMSTGGAPSVFRVIGYEPSWSGDVTKIQYDKLTAINYAFANVRENGTLEGVENVNKLDQLVRLAHQNGVEAFISIGGWNDGNDSAFHTMAGSSTSRQTFANEVLSFVQAHQLDGADIDWEYPDAGQSARDYTSLMTLLATTLHGAQKKLTAAVVAEGGDGIESAVFTQVDYLNLMAYDGGSGADHSPYSYAVASLDYWLGRGLPKSKCVLGVPFYGRPSWDAYSAIVAQDPNAANTDLSNGTYYNGIPTMQAKTKLARERASGIMIWELSQDTADSTSLLNAIHTAME